MTNREERDLDWLAVIGQLGDIARVRMLRLLEVEELGVGELARIIQLPQSTVSRHLKVLHEHGWLVKRSAGASSLYRVLADLLDADQRQLWETTRGRMEGQPIMIDDGLRLREVVAERRTDTRSFFGRVGGDWQDLRQELFGSGFGASALLGLIDPEWVVADLGCGTGEATELLAPLVREVISVDREPAMLKACAHRVSDFSNVKMVEADLQDLPMKDGSIDAAVLMLVMHHVKKPRVLVEEIARTLRPGGVLMAVDMVAHDREVYRFSMGHEHLGFNEEAVNSWTQGTSLSLVRYQRLRPNAEAKGPVLFAASMRKNPA